MAGETDQPQLYRDFARAAGMEGEVGPVTSQFQDIPFRGDLWTEQLYRGISGTIGAIWRNRNTYVYKYPVLDFEHEVYKNMEAKLSKYLRFYTKHGVNNEQSRTFTLELDADVVNDLFNPEEAGEKVDFRHRAGYLRALGQITEDVIIKHNMHLDIIVNQYAGFGKDSTDEEISAKSAKVNGQLHSFLGSELKERDIHNTNQGRLSVEGMLATDEGYWENYLDFAAQSGAKHVRLSAEFTKLFEAGNRAGVVFNEKEFAKFADIIRMTKERGMQFNLCMMHFTMPDFIEGGWENPDVAYTLANMSLNLMKRLKALDNQGGGDGTYMPNSVYTINEPTASFATGYVDGSWPPYKKAPNIGVGVDRYLRKIKVNGKSLALPIESVQRFEDVMVKAVDFHQMVFEGMKSDADLDHIPVGFTFNLPSYSPYYPIPTESMVSTMIEYVNEQWLHKLFERSQQSGKFLFDTFGLQYYNKYYVGMFKQTMAANAGVFDVPEWMKPFINGWTKFHEGMPEKVFRVNSMMLDLLSGLITDKKHVSAMPNIVISEAGFPSLVDNSEEMMMLASAIRLAKEHSIFDLKSVFLWTGRDNFEWASAYGNFGHLDRKGRRKPKGTEEIQGINPEVHSLHREIYIMIQKAEAIKAKLDENGMEDEDKLRFNERLANVKEFHRIHGGKFRRMRVLDALTGRILTRRI